VLSIQKNDDEAFALLVRPDDRERELTLTVLAFAIPAAERKKLAE